MKRRVDRRLLNMSDIEWVAFAMLTASVGGLIGALRIFLELLADEDA